MPNLPIAKKSLGQHWLTDRTALQTVVEAAEVVEGDAVLEIGPGTGTLTGVILEHGAVVRALEFDQELIKGLQKKYEGQPVEVVEGDIRSYDFGEMPGRYKIVANIPYYLTANLFRALIDTQHKPLVASLLVQKEVAERVTAVPGKMSFVAVALQLFYEARGGEVVPAYSFTPPPKVDSQLLILKKRPQPLLPNLDTEKFFGLVKAGFAQRRKKLKSSLKSRVGDKLKASELLAKSNIDPDARAQELSLEQWYQLYLALP